MKQLNFSGRKKLPFIHQSEQTECALACLAMILCYYGHKTDINSIRSKFNISQHGITLKTVMLIADKVNLASRPIRLEVNELQHLRLPAILHWNMNHFVVLKKVRRNNFIIHDPAIGVRTFNLKTISKHFTGIALELFPTNEFVHKSEEKKLRFIDLWNKSDGIFKSLFQLFILSLLIQIFSLALPFYTQLFIDDVLVNRDIDLLKILAIGFFIITIIKVFTELMRSFVVLHISNKISFQFAVNTFRHLLRLPVDFFSKRHMGDIVSRFGSLNDIKDFISSGIVEVVIDGIMVIGTLTVMFIYSNLLTLVVLIAVFIYASIRLFMYNTIRLKNEELISAGAIENTNFMETIRAIHSIKLFSKETDRNSVWQNYYADVINAGIKVQKLEIFTSTTHGLLVGSENIILMLLGGYAVLNNEISIGMIVAYFSYKDQFYGRVFAFMDKVFEFKLLDVHLSRLADIALSIPEKNTIGHRTLTPDPNPAGCLQATDISFRYSDDDPVLFTNINLEVDNDESIAIIGPTGCGKSTLLKIILSLLKPVNGEIYMNGIQLKILGLNTYRDRIAGVLQDDCLLSGSISENITFFDVNPDKDRVEYVASLAAIIDEIRAMPMQFNTLVGNMGTALSGGQIQRILLARALYKSPKLLVLDEATSHLDVQTESIVNQAIRELKIARVIVAHRPQTIKLADRILELKPDGLIPVKVMDSGRSMAGLTEY